MCTLYAIGKAGLSEVFNRCGLAWDRVAADPNPKEKEGLEDIMGWEPSLVLGDLLLLSSWCVLSIKMMCVTPLTLSSHSVGWGT